MTVGTLHPYVLTRMEKLLLRMSGSVTECKKSNSSNKRSYKKGRTTQNFLTSVAQRNSRIWLTVLRAQRPSQAQENNQAAFRSTEQSLEAV
eukprot:bmy_01251T0